MNIARLDCSNALDRWGAALARGDDAEVDRLVQQSRVDRAASTARRPPRTGP